MTYIFTLIILVIAEVFYFRIANHFGIIDEPNQRSSHSKNTIRGGGIIFLLAVILWFFVFGFQYTPFLLGLFLVASISFIDDLRDISGSIRLLLHIISITFLFDFLKAFDYDWKIVVFFYVIAVGIINAYNFMDGINGITGIYSLMLLLTLIWINKYQTYFVDSNLLIFILLGVIVFIFFNFRKNARCFAGDVGSVSLAFIVIFLILKLIFQTNQFFYILFLSVYGIDSVCTIFLRIIRRENIFLAHRSHLYQILVNERNFGPLKVSAGYGVIQLFFNIVLIFLIFIKNYKLIFLSFFSIILFYVVVRFYNDRNKTIVSM